MQQSTTPVVFASHGSPMVAIEDNSWSRALVALGEQLPKPRAVVAVSAHWCTRGTFVQASGNPPTIHDFGGFPRELFEVEYPAPGAPDLAEEVAGLLGADTTGEWGLDHGAWSVLRRLLPKADVPVVQVSLDMEMSPRGHLEAGRRLASLRGRGVLVLGSGTLTHNLRDAFARGPVGDTPAWAEGFDATALRSVRERDESTLLSLHATPEGRRAHPTPDHWLPLLWAYGASAPSDSVSCPVEGFDMGSMSMRAFLWS